MSKTHLSHISQFVYGSLFFFILITVAWLYWQGLSGIFLFDDKSNLQKLASIDEIEWFSDMLLFALEGEAGVLGRSISLFSFALQAYSWPLNPWDFKYVNLMIHLLNGCLVFWFILILTRFMALPEKRGLFLAFLTASIWLLHPLQVSTVLYVVQRMTQLSALFTLAGLLLYLHGRQLMAQQRIKAGFFWISLGVALGGILATLSKENGILLVLYIIVLEVTVLRILPKPRYWPIWSSLFLYLPLILLSLYFVTHIEGILQAYETRHFTLSERLLTEARVLIDYLAKILLLRPQGFGLFHDDFTVSHDLLTPPTTLISLSFILILFVVAIKVRRTLPILALGVLWFLAGQILESSFIGLLLYFEHRNYLPMLGILFSTLYGAMYLFDYLFSAFLRKLILFFSALLLALVPFLTWVQTSLWANPLDQAVFWAQQHPKSLAAQTHAAVFFQKIDEDAESEHYIRKMISVFPEYAAPYLYLIALSCTAEYTVKLPDKEKVIAHFKRTQYDHAIPHMLSFILEKQAHGQCHFYLETIESILKALLENPNNAAHKPYIEYRYAVFYFYQNRYELAVEKGKKALALKDSLQLRLQLIQWSILGKQFDQAKADLQALRTEFNPLKVRLVEKKLKSLEAEIHRAQEQLVNEINP
jgi:protein O-mannosyl-transferase